MKKYVFVVCLIILASCITTIDKNNEIIDHHKNKEKSASVNQNDLSLNSQKNKNIPKNNKSNNQQSNDNNPNSKKSQEKDKLQTKLF